MEARAKQRDALQKLAGCLFLFSQASKKPWSWLQSGSYTKNQCLLVAYEHASRDPTRAWCWLFDLQAPVCPWSASLSASPLRELTKSGSSVGLEAGLRRPTPPLPRLPRLPRRTGRRPPTWASPSARPRPVNLVPMRPQRPSKTPRPPRPPRPLRRWRWWPLRR